MAESASAGAPRRASPTRRAGVSRAPELERGAIVGVGPGGAAGGGAAGPTGRRGISGSPELEGVTMVGGGGGVAAAGGATVAVAPGGGVVAPAVGVSLGGSVPVWGGVAPPPLPPPSLLGGSAPDSA